MDAKQQDFYIKIRSNIADWIKNKEGAENKWADYILFAPDLFHLLCKLVVDRDVLVADKVKLAAAIAYFISPIDLLPEAIFGPVGYLDDLVLAAHVLNSIINNTDPQVLRKHWAGEGDVLEVIQSFLNKADQMLGERLWKKLKAKMERHVSKW